jgi:hypothetical protein
MSQELAEVSVELCQQDELDCRACVSATAQNLAFVSPHLTPEGVLQLFQQLYRNSGCRDFAHTFAWAYWTTVSGSTLHKPPAAETARVMAATSAA